MLISATASFSGTWTQDTSTSTTITPFNQIIDWSQIFACGIFESEADYKAFCNELRTEEYKKDLFRELSITPIETPYSQRATSYFIPAKRNFRGRQSHSY